MIRAESKNRRKIVAAAFAVALLSVGPRSASAVDVVNGDAAAYQIVVNDDDGGSKTLTLAPHQKVTGICDSCVIVLGRGSAEASKKDVVRISSGKISVSTK